MPDKKTMRLVVAESLREPSPADAWRIYMDDSKSLVIDFGRQTAEDEITMISSNQIPSHRVEAFAYHILKYLILYNRKYDLRLKLFNLPETQEESEGNCSG